MHIEERKAKIMQAFRANLANFKRHTPGGSMTDLEQKALIRCTARDSGCSITEVREEIWDA